MDTCRHWYRTSGNAGGINRAEAGNDIGQRFPKENQHGYVSDTCCINGIGGANLRLRHKCYASFGRLQYGYGKFQLPTRCDVNTENAEVLLSFYRSQAEMERLLSRFAGRNLSELNESLYLN